MHKTDPALIKYALMINGTMFSFTEDVFYSRALASNERFIRTRF